MQSKGFWVAFKPERDWDGAIQTFDIHVYHRMGQALHVAYDYLEADGSRYARKILMEAEAPMMLHSIAFDQLNNTPRLEFQFWPTEPIEGRVRHFSSEVKLKPKTFFKKLTTVDWQDGEVYLFRVLDRFPKEKQLTDNELETFKETFKKGPGGNKRPKFLVEKANMPDYIDLHAEKLFKSTSGKSNYEILRKQLRVFEEYLDKAVHHNLERVYIVHGYGKGKLRSEVHRLLEEYPHVISYSNAYEPRFGYGATEVVLG